MATAQIYTYVTWTALDGSQDYVGSLSTPVEISYQSGSVIDKSLLIKDTTETLLYDNTAGDPQWSWMTLVNSSTTDIQIVYIGTADTDSSAFVIKAGTVQNFISPWTMDYNADDQLRLVAAVASITKLWCYQASGADAALRIVYGA